MTHGSTDRVLPPRLAHERDTIAAMIALYCQDHHPGGGDLCAECQALLDYASARLRRCPFQENKPTCGQCTVHCYQPAMRARVRAVMRYAGPRMILRHPVMALRHALDLLRKTPALKKRAAGD